MGRRPNRISPNKETPSPAEQGAFGFLLQQQPLVEQVISSTIFQSSEPDLRPDGKVIKPKVVRVRGRSSTATVPSGKRLRLTPDESADAIDKLVK